MKEVDELVTAMATIVFVALMLVAGGLYMERSQTGLQPFQRHKWLGLRQYRFIEYVKSKRQFSVPCLLRRATLFCGLARRLAL